MAIRDLPMPRWLPGLQGLPLYLIVCDSHIQPPQSSDRASLPPSLSPILFIETVSLWNLIERKRACQVQLKYLPRVSKCQSKRKQPGSLLLASELLWLVHNSWINTDVFLFSSQEMTYRVFVFTWEISFKLHFWFCAHISHACHTTTEPKELQGCIPSAWCIPDTNIWAGSVWPLHGDQSHQPTLTTLLPLCPHMFIVAHTQVSKQTSLHAATDVVSFAKQATFAVFQETAATAFPTLSAAAAAGRKDDKME